MVLVNLNQTKEERREKYAYIRSMGFSSYWAIIMRDYHWGTIQRYIDYFARHPGEAESLGINIGGAMA